MSEPNATDAGPVLDGETPPAREHRDSVLLSAELSRFGASGPSRHRIRDLSSNGARIDKATDLRRGETVLISVGSLAAIGATVMWVADDVAGLHFFEPIDPGSARSKTIISSSSASAPPTLAARTRAATLAGWWADLTDVYG